LKNWGKSENILEKIDYFSGRYEKLSEKRLFYEISREFPKKKIKAGSIFHIMLQRGQKIMNPENLPST
jgi:hypothetical protein